MVTGASRGIGRAVAIELADRGWNVVSVARSATELEALTSELRRRAPGSRPSGHVADLSLEREVRRVAAEIRETRPALDVLINNAGAWFHRREETIEGVERTWALNVLAPLLLTESLRPALRAAAPARVIMVASAAHLGNHFDLDDVESRRQFRGFQRYGRSKLALIMLTRVLAERYRTQGISVNSLHPGFIRSQFGQNNPGAVGRGMWLLTRLAGRSAGYGARSAVWLATSPDAGALTGEYLVRGRPTRSSRSSYDADVAARLWSMCAERLRLEPRTMAPVPGGAR
ncbi:MAG: SDR family NAD(P)-dependent oxidoreductase [Thermoplasmata archaeon]|nr:SDR family NAD(P)-dependent oxidoreductase [Thermoplasmata archaeon]